MKSDSQETEAALIIRSENPEMVARRIASLTSIVDHRLLPQDSQIIHDVYFDTPDRALQSSKLALRVREIDATHWLTLKGPSQETNWGAAQRLEIEVPWSQEALTKVVKELIDRGIKMLRQHQRFDYAHPLEVMISLGLEVIQDRETHRQVRNVVPIGDETNPVLAELAIDSVAYHFGDQDICLQEVEIEAKRRDVSEALQTVIESLLGMYEAALQKWAHSKLATGKAIEKLLSEGALNGLIDTNNNLKPVAYDKIDNYFKRGGV